jgi:hypothetical protein
VNKLLLTSCLIALTPHIAKGQIFNKKTDSKIIISPLAYYSDYSNRGKYNGNQIGTGLSYEKQIGKRISLELPFVITYKNQFFYTRPGLKWRYIGNGKSHPFFTVNYILNWGREIACNQTGPSSFVNIDTKRFRHGAFLGGGWSFDISKKFSLEWHTGLGWYFKDSSFDYLTDACTEASLIQLLPNVFSSLSIAYSLP